MTARNPLPSLLLWLVPTALAAQSAAPTVFGYTDFTAQAKIESTFLAVPDAQLAGQHLKILTAEPHLAATPEDRKTADYVAEKFRQAGLETEIVPYRVLLNQPKVVRVEAFDEAGRKLMSGPTREHVAGDPYQDDPRVVMPFNGSSASGDVTGDVVYANYGRLEDFDLLAAQQIDLHGKIVICRYGSNFRGVKVFIAQQRGAVGVLMYSDPQDDGYFKGDAYPNGPWRPETGVQRGSVQFLFQYPGDPETPGVASTLDLPDSARIAPEGNQPHIVSIPISYHDAAPILKALKGPGVPQGWQGALPFRYHLGASEHSPAHKIPARPAIKAPSKSTWSRSRTISAASSGMSSEKSPAQPTPTTGSSPAIIATHGSMARSIPTAAPPPCLNPFTASALCSSQAGVPNERSFSQAGTRKKKA